MLKGGTSPALGASELWMADIGSGRNEPLFPGVAITGYELSQDGKRIVFSANGSTGANQLWIASADRTDPPRRIPNAEGDMPDFLGPHEVVFHAIENGSTFAFRIREDGTGVQKLNASEINEIKGASPDEKFVVAWSQGTTKAFPSSGGDSVPIMDEICFLRWQPSRKFLYLSVITGMQSAGAFGRTYVIPSRPGRLFPAIPPAGFHSEAEIARLPGVRVIEAADVPWFYSWNICLFASDSATQSVSRPASVSQLGLQLGNLRSGIIQFQNPVTNRLAQSYGPRSNYLMKLVHRAIISG